MNMLHQPSLLDAGTPLYDVTFVVVDLETTGAGSNDAITEIGAVKVRGGQVLGEFQTLVNPHRHIPAGIAVMTGITDAMVAGAPGISQVLPTFLEFVGHSVLVAHNARFDVGFLTRACQRADTPWPALRVLDTVQLARSTLMPGEVPNVKLGTLAAHFRTAVTPDHRALSDARATVDVLHGLLERLGGLGVSTLDDLAAAQHKVSPERRRKRTWAKDLPESPGVYRFVRRRGETDEVLYVGRSRNLRRRVATYFTHSESRKRMEEMIRLATGVEHTVCVTELEAVVTELRMIESHGPRYNRRSTRPRKLSWLRLTQEAFPRLSVVRTLSSDGAQHWGPLPSRREADDILAALYDAHPIRQCTTRLSARSTSGECALAGLGTCLAPCREASAPGYADVVAAMRATLNGDLRPLLEAPLPRLSKLIAQERFEEAAQVRRRVEAACRFVRRHHRQVSLARCPELVAAKRCGTPGRPEWEIHVIRYGKLARAAVARPGDDPRQVARAAVATAETVLPQPHPLPAGTVEECERIADWLETPGVRFLETAGEWWWPLHLATTSRWKGHLSPDAPHTQTKNPASQATTSTAANPA